MNIAMDNYIFEIPVRVFAAMNTTNYSMWIQDVITQPTNLAARFTVPVKNFCEVTNLEGYTFDFGTMTERIANAVPFVEVNSGSMDLDVECVSNASLSLSFTATTPYQGTANHVSMGTDAFYADFYINGLSQATLSKTGASTYSVPLQAILKRSSTATDIAADVYTGTGTLRVTIE